MCCEVPTPAEPKLILPGLALRVATSSCTLFAGTFGLTTTTFFSSAAMARSSKSLSASNGSFDP